MNAIEILNETIQIIKQGSYRRENQEIKLKLNSDEYRKAIYLSEEEIKLLYKKEGYKVIKSYEKCLFNVTNRDSFEAALKMNGSYGESYKKVLVLNFANPVSPGGGVRYGAKAQEEDLCRKSTLLFSLESQDAFDFYLTHQKSNSNLSSHAMILSPNVEIIRDSTGGLLSETQTIAVLTCAAPINIGTANNGISKQSYEKLLFERIRYMLYIAAKFGYKELVLGAWGCGAFNNDAKLIAKLFQKAFNEKCTINNYVKDYFHKVEFAVLCNQSEMYNFNCFYSQFVEKRNEGIRNNKNKWKKLGIGAVFGLAGVVIRHITKA